MRNVLRMVPIEGTIAFKSGFTNGFHPPKTIGRVLEVFPILSLSFN